MTTFSDPVFISILSAGSFTPPAGCVTDASVIVGANISASKLVHQVPLTHYSDPAVSIPAATKDIHIVRGTAGVTLAVKAAITGVIPTTTDTVTVDVQRSTGGGAFATVLTGTIGFALGDTLRTAKSGTINTSALVAGDILRVVVTVTGTSAKGLVVDVTVQENPN